MSTLITYEHPLNERIRTFLRLEHLFGQLDHFVRLGDAKAERAAIDIMLEIVAVTARADVKNDILKELERHVAILGRIANQRGVDPEALAQVLGDLDSAVQGVQQISGPIGHCAREDEFLKNIAQRSSIPGGTCSFDLPHFQYWLIQPQETHQARFEEWLSDLRPAIDAIKLTLSLIRSSASSRQVLAEGGFFQEALAPQLPAQMLRVGIASTEQIYPEISGHRNRFSIRFMNGEARGRPALHNQDVSFKLTCCVL